MPCSVAHCDRETVARNLCSKHYQAWRKYGDPGVVKQKQHHGRTVRERFFLYTRTRNGCWEWLGYKDRNGYGRLNIKGVPQLASRVCYNLHFGEVPAGKAVCHKCDNPGCVNPDHLFVGTQADNVADMHDKGRARKRAVRGLQHHNAKLNEDAVRKIRQSKQTVSEIARQHGVSRAVVYDVRKRRVWRHVPE